MCRESAGLPSTYILAQPAIHLPLHYISCLQTPHQTVALTRTLAGFNFPYLSSKTSSENHIVSFPSMEPFSVGYTCFDISNPLYTLFKARRTFPDAFYRVKNISYHRLTHSHCQQASAAKAAFNHEIFEPKLRSRALHHGARSAYGALRL